MARLVDWFRGSGAFAVTVPPMDGALKPNERLEHARVAATIERPDNLIVDDGRICFSSTRTLNVLNGPGNLPWREVATFGSEISCLASDGSGTLAIGLDEGRIVIRGGRHDGRGVDVVADRPLRCPTACVFKDSNTLIVCLGSVATAPSQWKADLMARGQSGSVWEIALATGRATLLADRLAYPFGVLVAGDRVIVSESWKHRLIALNGSRAPEALLSDLPAYPSRIAPGRSGRYWLSAFAPRLQMVEFVLRESGFRQQMMKEVPQEYWMAPALSSGRSHLEPLQGGSIRRLGILKPWSPSRSYGLLIQLDQNFRPVASLHSRAGGTRHGITSSAENGRCVYASAKGGNAILAIAHSDAGGHDDA